MYYHPDFTLDVITSTVLFVRYDEAAGLDFLSYIDITIVACFVLEVVIKIMSYSVKPWLYFTSRERIWNIFDFSITLVSVCSLALGAGESKGVGALRLLRLLKLMKILTKIPRLRVIFEGLSIGIGQIANITILMGIVVYMFSVLGVLLFRENDPWRFIHVGSALQTLVLVATGDWLGVFYTNFYGCDQYDGGGIHVARRCSPITIGRHGLLHV
jgi:voltage-gated sodium channel